MSYWMCCAECRRLLFCNEQVPALLYATVPAPENHAMDRRLIHINLPSHMHLSSMPDAVCSVCGSVHLQYAWARGRGGVV